MKKTALPLILFMLLALAACGGDTKLEKLAGVWVADVEASLKMDDSMKDLDPQAKEFAVGMAKALLSNMSIEFDVTGKKIITKIGPNSENSDFTVESVKDKKIALKVDGDMLDIELIDDNTILFGPAEGNRMVFVRKK